MKKIMMAGLIGMFCAYGAQAATISSISSGSWTNSAVWNAGVPAAGDVVYVQGHSVTSAVSVVSLKTLATLHDDARLVLESGANLSCSNSMVLNKGLITVGAGASLSKLAGAGNTYIHLPRDSNRTVEMVIDGGSVNCAKAMYLGGQSNDSGITATLSLNDGSLTVDKQLIIGGGSNLDANMFINGGTAQMDFLQFGATDQNQSEDVTVDGGDLVLTTANEAGSLVFSGAWSSLFCESGSIVFKGVDSQTDFDAFQPVFNGWVDTGNVTSTVYSASELKHGLTFVGGDAVLYPPAVYRPNPINTPNVFVDPNLASISWETSDENYTYDIYLSPDKSLVDKGDDSVLLAGGHTSTSVNVSLNNTQQRYYWRVDAINGGTTKAGATWTFVVGDSEDTGSDTYYVATHGSDLNAGTEAEPFATIQRAANRIGCDIMAGATSDKTVYIRGGKYYLESTIIFDDWSSPDDANQTVTYRNYPGEKPVIVGGTPITGWELDSGSVYKTYVGIGTEFYGLFENNQRSTMAREPDSGYNTIGSKVSDTEFVYTSGDYSSFDYSDAQVKIWEGERHWNWATETLPITAVNFATRAVTIGNEVWLDDNGGNRYFIQGAKEFLDSPGEFYLDQSTGWLYYWPVNTPIASQEIIAPATGQRLLEIKGSSEALLARNLHVEGLTFTISDVSEGPFGSSDVGARAARNGLVHIEDAHNITVQFCKIQNAGFSAVQLDKYNQDITIYGNLIDDFGCHGVYLHGWQPGEGGYSSAAASYVSKNNLVSNNRITNGGKLVGHGNGIRVIQSGDNEISHNEIKYISRGGIKVAGTALVHMPSPQYGVAVTESNYYDFNHSRNNVIKFNDASACMLDSQDGGVFYTSKSGRDNILDNNRLHDSWQATLTPAYVYGIYIDDRASYWTVTNNIVYGINSVGGKSGCPLFVKGTYNSFINNILADNSTNTPSGPRQVRIQATNGLYPASHHLTFSNNIYDQVNGYMVYKWQEWFDETDRVESDYNLLYHPGGSYNVEGIPGDETWENWKTLFGNKFDQNSVIGDPLFVDRANHDYTVQPGSPALSLGFVNIDQDSIGLKDDFFVRITESGDSTAVDEEGPTSDTYTVALGVAPTTNVVVTIQPDAQTEINGNGGGNAVELTFTPTNWDTVQTVTVSAVDDADYEGAHTSTIQHSASSSDANYSALLIDDLVVSVADNDVEVSLLETWQQAHFTAQQIADGAADLDQDPDGDLLDNLAEYALGGVPTNGADAAAILPTAEIMADGETNRWEYVYRRRNDYAAHGLIYTIEVRSNLVSGIWTTNGVEEVDSAGIDAEFDSVTNRISTEGGDQQFLRLKIEKL